MKRLMLSFAAMSAAAVLTAGLAGAQTVPATSGQKTVPATDPTLTPRPAGQAPATPSAAGSAAEPSFPPVDAKNFTAASPTPETVNSFLHALWGVDANRTWSVAAIQPTIAPGVVRIQVYVAEKTQPTRIASTTMYITPDGKHAIAGEIIDFGAQPFAQTRAILQQRADGPARGAASKDLEVVEFVDFQNQNSKAVQSTIDQMVQDFPQAHVVFENVPQAAHPFGFQAAAVGNCVRQAKGDPAFFVYAQKVVDAQADLTKEKVDATLRSAVTAAGADPAAAMTCANSPAAQGAVNASVKLASDLGISVTPALVVNGRILPAQVPYAGLKRVIAFQGTLDGIAVKEQPSLKTLK